MPRVPISPAGYVAPMLPTLVDAAPDGDDWVHEVKYDGYRTEIAINGRKAQAYTRNGYDWSERYASVLTSALALRCRSALIDGEMCVQNAKGVTDYKALRRAIRPKGPPFDDLVLFAFDLLMLNGRDLRAEPLRDRRRRLQDLIGVEIASRVHFSEGHEGGGPAFFRAADRHGLEGIVSKRPDSLYVSGRSAVWQKIKSFAVGEFSVIGVERSSTGLPVALLATGGSSPAYVGDVMVTLKAKERETFWATVDRLGMPQSRLAGTIRKRKAAWLKEGLVARVRHLRGEDKLRHATVQSVSEGKAQPEDGTARHPDGE